MGRIKGMHIIMLCLVTAIIALGLQIYATAMAAQDDSDFSKHPIRAEKFSGDSRWFSFDPDATGINRVTVTAMQPLDAEGNPYAGLHTEWDSWAFENFQSGFSITDIGEHFQYPYDPQPDEDGKVRQWMDLKVDADGYLVPWSYWLESWGNDDMHYGSQQQAGEDLATGFAMGMIDADLHARWKLAIEEARNVSRSAAYPVFPRWLMQQEPLQLIVVPNGEYCVKGPFGITREGMTTQDVMDLKYRERWYRYSAEGELLESGRIYPSIFADHAWICFYWPEFPEKLAQMYEAGYSPLYRDSRISFMEIQSRQMEHEAEIYFNPPKNLAPGKREIVATFDYMGRELSEAQAELDDGQFISLEWPLAGEYFRAQLSEGKVAEDSDSPFEGQANGPVRVDGDYSPPAAVEPPNQDSRSTQALLEVRDPDEPANPWRGQYSKWDLLCLEFCSQRNEDMTDLFAAKRERMQELIDETKGDGKQLQQFIDEHPRLSTSVSEDDMREARIATLVNAVDDDGFLVPAARTNANVRGGDFAQYIRAYVTLNSAEYDEFVAWKAGLTD